MERLRVGFIGGWGHIDAVLGEMEHLPWVECVGWATARPEEDWELFRKKYETGRRAKEWGSVRALLEEGRPQVAVVSTRLDLIGPLAMEAARAGCDLVCEKPLALTHGGLAELRRAVREQKVLCIGMLGNRVHPVLAAAREVVASGEIGEVVLVNASKSYKWGERPEWFGKRSLYGGTIGWIGIHGLDFIYTVTGQDFTSVAAMQSNVAKKERPECEDHCALVLGLSGGGHATLSVDFLRPQAAATHGNDWFRVVGSKGTIEANMTQGWCTVTTGDGPQRAVTLPAERDYYAEFFEQVRDGRREEPGDMRKAFYLTHVSLWARDAADEGRVVAIPAMA